MATVIRAIYEHGMLRPLDPLELKEGQEVQVQIQRSPTREELKAALADMDIRWADPTWDEDAWVEDMAEELAVELSKGRSLSEIIIEEREDRF